MIEAIHFAGLFAGLLIGATGLSASPQAHLKEQFGNAMNFMDQQVAEKFAEFEKKQDPTFIYEALDSIEAAESKMPPGDTDARKQALSRRLDFFAALDRNIDPNWDPKNVPPQGVAPPPSSQGIVYGSGEVDPASISDPQERAKYIQALKENKTEIQRYSVQFELRRIDERAMRFVERLLADRYTNSEADRREFEELLASSSVNEQRKERLRALMAKPDSSVS